MRREKMEINHEQEFADRLLQLSGWKDIDVNEHNVELFFDAALFPLLSRDIITLKNEFSFVAHIRYETMGHGIVAFENIYHFGN
jgi:hypothetical protein